MEILRKYGAATTILFPLVDRDAVDFESTPVTFASGDRVDSASTSHHVISFIGKQDIGTGTTGERVVAVTADNRIVS